MKKNIQQFLLFIGLIFCSTISFSQDAITIAEAREVDAEGALVRLNQNVILSGIAIGPNFRAGGHSWVLFDAQNNIGITVFAFNNDVGYEVNDGDILEIIGDLDEFNGLAELVPSTITVIDRGVIPDPEVVTDLSESTEAKLVTIVNVTLVDPSQWGTGSFNVDITNGTSTMQVRIDSDTDISGMPAPQGTFNITGVGGQFDNSAPYTEGYQLFPRKHQDINPYDTGGNNGPMYERLTLEQAREVDGDLATTREGQNIEVSGVVHGINFRPSGLQFTIINANNVGIGIFSSSNTLGYSFKESDNITVWGRLTQFNGLTQINPDSIVVNSTNNILTSASEKSGLNETTESSRTSITMTGWVDPSQWLGNGSSFNVDFHTSSGVDYTIRIDSDTELANASIPDGFSIVTGIGGQFDSSAPFDSGYQLFPMLVSDFEPYLSVENPFSGSINIYPNPVSEILNIDTDIDPEKIEIYNIKGQKVFESERKNSFDISILSKGIHIIKVYFNEEVHTQRILVD